MRTIKFRGKRIDNGEWVYGDLVIENGFKNQPQKYLIRTYTQRGLVYCEVNSDTIGQFTGLYDKNRKEIYEGDIIQGEYNHKHLIRYAEDEACFTATLVEYVGNGFAERWNTGDVTQKWIDEFSKVVIGDIHDNKELLTQTIKQ